MSIDKAKLSKMMAEMAAIGAKYGYAVVPAGGSMSETNAKIKFDVKTKTATGEIAVSASARSMARIESIDIEKTFTFNGKVHRIVDYHPRKYKAPWITLASDGKQYKWSTSSVKLHMAAKTMNVAQDGLAHLLG